MPEWHKWVNEDWEELDDQYETIQKIKKNKNKPIEERTTHRKKENHRIPRPDKE